MAGLFPHQEMVPQLRFPAEMAIMAPGLRVGHGLANALADHCEVHMVGDCVRLGDASGKELGVGLNL